MHTCASTCPVTGDIITIKPHSVSFKWLYVCKRNVCERYRDFSAFTQESLVCNSLRIIAGDYFLHEIIGNRSVSYFCISCPLRILWHEFDDSTILI